MSSSKRAMLFIGSPKKTKSTSESLGNYLSDALRNNGFEVNKVHVTQLINYDGTERNIDPEFFSELDNIDVLIFSFPLYIDSLPAITIKALEVIGKRRKGSKRAKNPLMVALVNSGFPEAHQNNTALAICRCFAKEAGFGWAGGLAVGGGASILGNPVEKVYMFRNLTKTLDLTAKCISLNKPLNAKLNNYQVNPILPVWLYNIGSKVGAKLLAKANGVSEELYDRPLIQKTNRL